MPSRKERRNAPCLCGAGKLDSVLILAQLEIAEDQVNNLAVEHLQCFIDSIDRCHDFVAGVAQHVLIVERRQRLILDDKDALDDLVALPEQHPKPRQMTLQPERTNKRQVPPRRGRRPTVPAGPQRADGPQRIAKLLARAGVASRREIERMIAEGRIALNGEKLLTPATLLQDLGGVTVDGRPVRPASATRLFRFYKPQGTITAAHDPKGRPTIYDRLPGGLPRVMPVGRLDFMTEGLLLLTNDGELKRQLE